MFIRFGDIIQKFLIKQQIRRLPLRLYLVSCLFLLFPYLYSSSSSPCTVAALVVASFLYHFFIGGSFSSELFIIWISYLLYVYVQVLTIYVYTTLQRSNDWSMRDKEMFQICCHENIMNNNLCNTFCCLTQKMYYILVKI